MSVSDPTTKPFGTVFAPRMTVCEHVHDTERNEGSWTDWKTTPVEPVSLHPGAHVLHYASSCFEGLKAYRWKNGDVRIFRLDKHVARMQKSAALLHLPIPAPDVVADMIRTAVKENVDHIPDYPGSLYIRPTLFGTSVDIGAAAVPSPDALFYILCSPVGDYFSGGLRPLRVLLADRARSTPEFGMVKAGANYAQALGPVLKAKADLNCDQVLFCPAKDPQETGAANFVLMDDNRIITRHLDSNFLHGVTRDSLLTIAKDLGYAVEERGVAIPELLEFCKSGEAGLSGTAAVLAPIGTFVFEETEYTVGDGGVGANTNKLRQALVDIQAGEADDAHGWLTAP